MGDEKPLPSPDAPEQGTISIGDLIRKCQNEARRPRIRKHTANLLMNAAYALHQLWKRLDKLESERRLIQ